MQEVVVRISLFTSVTVHSGCLFLEMTLACHYLDKALSRCLEASDCLISARNCVFPPGASSPSIYPLASVLLLFCKRGYRVLFGIFTNPATVPDHSQRQDTTFCWYMSQSASIPLWTAVVSAVPKISQD